MNYQTGVFGDPHLRVSIPFQEKSPLFFGPETGHFTPLETAPQRVTSVSPLWGMTIKNKKITFRTPLLIEVYEEGGRVVAKNRKLNLFGVGKRLEDSLNDLFTGIIQLSGFYSKLDLDRLTQDGKKLKQILADLFV